MGWGIKKSPDVVSKEKFSQELLEKRDLPMGRKEFELWSDRIIAIANVPADSQSQKFALADFITHLDATECFKEDAYFIKMLRKVAVNQVAVAMREDYRNEVKARIAKEEAENKLKLVKPEAPKDEPAPFTQIQNDSQVLAKKDI